MSETERDTVAVTIVSGDLSFTLDYPREVVEDGLAARPYLQAMMQADLSKAFDEDYEFIMGSRKATDD